MNPISIILCVAFILLIIGGGTYITSIILISSIENDIRTAASIIDSELMEKQHVLKQLLAIINSYNEDKPDAEKLTDKTLEEKINLRFGMTATEATYAFTQLRAIETFLDSISDKMSDEFSELNKRYKETNISVASAGNKYNNLIQKYNSLIVKFPVVMIANIKNKTAKMYFN